MIHFDSPQHAVLITGAYGGIGTAYCHEYAAQGRTLALNGRDSDKLEQLAAELRSQYPQVDIHTFPLDLSRPSAAQELYAAVTDSGLFVEVLVNNAGILRNEPVHESSTTTNEDMVAVNITALTSLTTLAVKDMVDRGHGHIINMASTASWIAIPEQNIYAATKAYVRQFTIALNDELKARKTNVGATAVCPNWTDTRMMDDPDQGKVLGIPRFTYLTPRTVAQAAVKAAENGKTYIIPGRFWSINMYLSQFLPITLTTKVFGWYYRKVSAK